MFTISITTRHVCGCVRGARSRLDICSFAHSPSVPDDDTPAVAVDEVCGGFHLLCCWCFCGDVNDTATPDDEAKALLRRGRNNS